MNDGAYRAPDSLATHFKVSGPNMSVEQYLGIDVPRSTGQLAQHVLQDAAALEVVEFVDGIDAADQRYALQRAVARDDLGHQLLARLEVALQAADGDRARHPSAPATSRTCLPRRFGAHDAHADQIRAVDALE